MELGPLLRAGWGDRFGDANCSFYFQGYGILLVGSHLAFREVPAERGIGEKHCSSAKDTALSTRAWEGSKMESMVRPGSEDFSVRRRSGRLHV